ncbi:MAG: WhiB family transcriptional regulator [Georgenia sp.]
MQLTALLDQISQRPSVSWPTTTTTPTPAPAGAARSFADDPGRGEFSAPPPMAGAIPCRRGADTDLWFAERTADVERAKALCRACPVRQACLTGALERSEPWGVWGGEVFQDGVVVARKRGRGRPRKDGTAA